MSLRHFTKEIDMKLLVERKVTADDIVVQLDQLYAAREHYEANEYLRSNQKLYELLSTVLGLYYRVHDNKQLLSKTLEVVKARLGERNIRVQRNSLALTLFVRYAFNTDRQRALNYSRALQAAFQANVQPDGFAQFVEDCGGIEECKRKVIVSDKTLIQRQAMVSATVDADIAIELAKDEPLAIFNVDPTDVSEHCSKGLMFAAVQAEADGTVSVLYVVPTYNAFVERWAKQALARKYADIAAAEQKTALEEATKQALEAAAAAATSAPEVEAEELLQAA
jgi:hypothetical protein